MKTFWYDNKPKYQEGDIILYGISTVKKVTKIKEVKITPLTEDQKRATEELNKKRKPHLCCGGKDRAKREALNDIQYKTVYDEYIYKSSIEGGIDKINEYIKDLHNEIDHVNEIKHKLGVTLGYINEY